MRSERASCSLDAAIIDLSRRELGVLHTKRFANRLAASQDLVLLLDVYKKLQRHRDCVNTISFSQDGDLLVSGSDDRRVIVWDWQSGGVKLSFHPGHNGNIFQAKFMPYTDDRTIVTCAADGQVRCAQISDCGQVETKLLGRHRGRVFNLVIEPTSPHNFYTCGEDGLVQHRELSTNWTRHTPSTMLPFFPSQWDRLSLDGYGESLTNGRLELVFNFNINDSDSSSIEGGESSANEDF